jgi:hypothetical protein
MDRMKNPFAATPVAIRGDLTAALGRAWMQLGAPGAWLTGGERLAVAAAARQAWDCGLCVQRQSALTPSAISGAHDHRGDLPAAWTEIIHRVVTDSGRLSERWFRQALTDGVLEDEFIEIVSVAVITVTLDTFADGIGLGTPALPGATADVPARQPTVNAKPGPGWVSTLAPEDTGPDFADFYANDSHFYIRRALTLVPAETRRFWVLMNQLYLADPRMHELDGIERAITRGQMEFLAARASALLGCYY